MRISKSLLTALLLLSSMTLLRAEERDTCIIKTSLGDITVELYTRKAPLTVANFLKYVDGHLFDSTTFFRAVRLDNQKDSIKIELIQGGGVDTTKEFAPIPLERTTQTGLAHRDGTLSMARWGPNTATSSFFICINDQPSLDYDGKRKGDGEGFAAFGQVITGMDVVKKIQNLYPAQKQFFKPTVPIITIVRRQ